MPDTAVVPEHIGIVLDGNRRWARQNGLSLLEGHRRGADNLKTIAEAAFRRGVKYFSAFVFSTENWSRTQDEVSYLMGLVSKVAGKYLDEAHKDGIKVLILGSREGLQKNVLSVLEKVEQKTANNTKGVMALCFNYGGQQEIVDAVKKIIEEGSSADKLTTDSFANALYTPEVPEVDLLIRTSGERRTSGFMLYRSAYSELYFTDKYWPEFSVDDLDAAIDEYQKRQRRFGR